MFIPVSPQSAFFILGVLIALFQGNKSRGRGTISSVCQAGLQPIKNGFARHCQINNGMTGAHAATPLQKQIAIQAKKNKIKSIINNNERMILGFF